MSTPLAAPVGVRNETVDFEHLSYSSLFTYSNCPRKFQYRYIDHCKPEFLPAALAFGGAVHRAVESIHQARIAGEPISPVESLMATYDEAWAILVTGDAPVQFSSSDSAESLRGTAERILSLYRDQSAASESEYRVIAIEHATRFEFAQDLPPIEMRADLVELNASGDLVVTDFKTSRARWGEFKVQEALPQLVLYVRGLESMAEALRAKRIVPRFTILTKGKKPVLQQINPTIAPEDYDRVKRSVLEIWNGIQKEVFVPRTGWQCTQCPYKRQCLG